MAHTSLKLIKKLIDLCKLIRDCFSVNHTTIVASVLWYVHGMTVVGRWTHEEDGRFLW